MIRKFIFAASIAVSALFASCGGTAETDGKDSTAQVSDSSSVTKLSLVDYNAKAADYVGKEIELTGIVDHVCKHGGKKILLVADGQRVHIMSNDRFEDGLNGSEITVRAKVSSERIDESTFQKWLADETNTHSEGQEAKERMEKINEDIKFYRDSMATAKVDHLMFYDLEYVSHTVKK